MSPKPGRGAHRVRDEMRLQKARPVRLFGVQSDGGAIEAFLESVGDGLVRDEFFGREILRPTPW